ncbi:MAG: oligosaccharide flippase family protein [Candidatus Cloacimonetes bacterium]|nr:oligosaccharide flippase family protein [Candidatus Cloacimonadota bacterium]
MKGYLRKTLEYGAGNLFNKLILLLLLPLFTHRLQPEEYAVYTNLFVFIAFASLVFFLGLQQALFSYFNYQKTPAYRFNLLSSIYITVTITGLLFTFLICIYRVELSSLILRDSSYQNLLIITAFILLFDLYHGLTLVVLNNMEKSTLYVVLGMVKNIFFLVLIIIITLLGRFGIKEIFQVVLLSSFLSFLISLIVIFKLLRFYCPEASARRYYSFGLMRKVLSFGLIMIPGTLAMMILSISDRYMLTYLSARGLHDVGIYAIGYRIGMIMSFLTSLISRVYYPYAMKIAHAEGSVEKYRRMFDLYIVTGCILGTLVLVYTPEIFHLFIAPSYQEGIKIVFCGVISIFLLGIFNLINISFYIRQKAENIALTVGSGAILNIILNFLLIPRLGIYGAGLASIIAYLGIVIFNYLSAERLYKIGYNLKNMIISLIILFMATSLNFVVPASNLITAVKIILTIVIGFLFIGKIVKNHDIMEFLKAYLTGRTQYEIQDR